MSPESRDLNLQSKGHKSEHHFLSSPLHFVVLYFINDRILPLVFTIM